jgi:hypothetical protein
MERILGYRAAASMDLGALAEKKNPLVSKAPA